MSANLFKSNRRDALALAALLLAALAFGWPLFVPGWIIPQGGGDLVSFLWPSYHYAAQTLHQVILGQAPFSALLWNPTLYSGAPFAADNQTGLFYPPNLILFLLFPSFPYWALEALVILHLFIAGAGMYVLVRAEIGWQAEGPWRPTVGILAGLAFMASDVFITHLGNYNIDAVSAYLPWVFWALRHTLRTPNFGGVSLRWALLTGLLFGLAALAGHAQMAFILALACGIYGLYEFIRQRRWQVLGLGAIAAIVTFGIAAIALLPALEMLQYTARAGLSYGDAAKWSLPPLGLAGMLSPLVFGRGAHDFWPAWDRVELGYLGLVPLLLVPFARGKQTWPYWLLAGIGLVIALGGYTPVHYLLFRFVPGFASLRVPARFILLTDFSLVVLAGLGFSNLLANPGLLKIWAGKVQAGLWLAGLFIGAVWILLAPVLLQHGLAWTALAVSVILAAMAFALAKFRPAWLPVLVFAELFLFGGFVEVDKADPLAGYQPSPAVEWLKSQPGPTRIDLASGPWQPDAPAVFGLESITGIANPLALANYDNYYWSVNYRGSPQYNFLNAQYVVAAKNSPPADSSFVPVYNEDPNVDVYLNTNAMPRIQLIQDAVFASDTANAFQQIHDPTFNPTAQVVLEIPAGYQAASPAGTPTPATNLFYTSYGAGQFGLVVDATQAAYVVVAEVWYPGWGATLNGKPATILRANTAFMAVAVPPGESSLNFQFTSPLFNLGALITAATLIGSLAGLGWGWRRHATA